MLWVIYEAVLENARELDGFVAELEAALALFNPAEPAMLPPEEAPFARDPPALFCSDESPPGTLDPEPYPAADPPPVPVEPLPWPAPCPVPCPVPWPLPAPATAAAPPEPEEPSPVAAAVATEVTEAVPPVGFRIGELAGEDEALDVPRQSGFWICLILCQLPDLSEKLYA